MITIEQAAVAIGAQVDDTVTALGREFIVNAAGLTQYNAIKARAADKNLRTFRASRALPQAAKVVKTETKG